MLQAFSKMTLLVAVTCINEDKRQQVGTFARRSNCSGCRPCLMCATGPTGWVGSSHNGSFPEPRGG
jgi:hypothetical protein